MAITDLVTKEMLDSYIPRQSEEASKVTNNLTLIAGRTSTSYNGSSLVSLNLDNLIGLGISENMEQHYSSVEVTYEDNIATITGNITTSKDSSAPILHPFTFTLPIEAGEGVTIAPNSTNTGLVVSASGSSSTVIKTTEEWRADNTILDAGVFGYDSTLDIMKFGDGVTSWNKLKMIVREDPPTFENLDWATIASISESGRAADYFSVGDTKIMNLKDGTEIEITILGFSHDTLYGGGGTTAGISISMTGLLSGSYAMVEDAETPYQATPYSQSTIHTVTLPDILNNQFPDDLKNVIKRVSKSVYSISSGASSGTIRTLGCYLWLPSYTEITGDTSDDVFNGDYHHEGSQYEYWKSVKDGTVPADRIKYYPSGTSSDWWTRSPVYYYDQWANQHHFVYFNTSGSARSASLASSSALSVCFCV